MLNDDERLVALINNLDQWSGCSGAYHLEQEDIPIVLDALRKYRAARMMREIAEKVGNGKGKKL